MKRIDWRALDARARTAALARPLPEAGATLARDVAALLADVRARGDDALRELTLRLDRVARPSLRVPRAQLDAAADSIAPALRGAMQAAHARIAAFHRACAPAGASLETAAGVRCERVIRAIARVGLYVPAGSAPLPSTALMLGVPAQLAGCSDVVLCSPPRADGSIDPAVALAARMCGITQVFALGGAQAIAAMAYGSDSVPRCDKLFGPGNAWVTEAKRQVALEPRGPAIDMQAGPSELLIVADDTAEPAFIAADLLSQAEHGADSQVLLASPDEALLDAVAAQLTLQLETLPRAAIARESLAHARAFRVHDVAQALELANAYAPEHLALQLENAREWLPRVRSAGSVFLGRWSPEAIGDYGSGTNHVLPTDGAARACSGVSVASFVTMITVQELTRDGLARIGPDAVALANAESLHGHARAVTLRLQACA